MNKEKLIVSLQRRVNFIVEEGEDLDSACWSYQEGILITGNEAELFIELLENDLNPNQ